MAIESFVHCGPAISQMPFEVIEIKGLGHPDTICDLISEHLADAVCESLPEGSQTDIFMVGQIGSPVIRPSHVFCKVIVSGNHVDASLKEEANRIMMREINKGEIFHLRNRTMKQTG